MPSTTLISSFLLLVGATLQEIAPVNAHAYGDHHHEEYHRRHPTPTTQPVELDRRQASPYPTGPQYDVPPLASITPTPVTYTENTLPVIATYTPGSQPPISGAPPLPAYTIVPSDWPDLQNTPPVDSDEVRQWLQELEGHDIPDWAPNPTVDCGNATVAAAVAAAGANGRCWWSCGNCVRDTDITTCANEWEYGHTYDDGPGFYTNKLLTYLDSQSLKATFFVVGARVISRPQIVVYEYMNNFELSVHTWSHPALTTLTNEEIVAELGWTRKAIQTVTGVTPLTFRPPYGDVDDRVRAIALAMGMRPVIWTSSMQGVAAGGAAVQWDSQDWRVHAGDVQSVANQASFEAILNSTSQFASGNTTDPHGVIILQHDIYVESVNLAIGYTIPFALQHQPPFKMKTVTECQGRPLSDAYFETNTDNSNPAAQNALAAQAADNSVEIIVTPTVINGVTTTVTLSSSTHRSTGTSTSSSSTGAAGKTTASSLAGLLIAGVVAALF